MVARRLRRLALPADTRDRHLIAARLAGDAATVLDVGGVAGQLALFMPGGEVRSLNVEGRADQLFDGGPLPFADRSFEAVTSLDVLEHLPAPAREAHVGDLARVAGRRVVLCCPLGTPEHVEAERRLADWYESATGRRHRFLDEHLERGLPTEEELRLLAESTGRRHRLLFHGDFREVERVFRLSVLARRRPAALLAYAREMLRGGEPAELQTEPTETTNRAYLVAETASQ